MKSLFTIIAASLLLGTASMAAEHTGIDNNSAYLDLRPNDTTRHLYIARQGNAVVKFVVK